MKAAQIIDPVIFGRKLKCMDAPLIVYFVQTETPSYDEIEMTTDVPLLQYKLTLPIQTWLELRFHQFPFFRF